MALPSALALSLALPLILTLRSQGTEGPFASAFAGAICGSPEMYSSAVPGATAWHLPRSWRSADMMLSYPHGIHCELGLFRVWNGTVCQHVGRIAMLTFARYLSSVVGSG